ncbi:succinate dehydrogenase assembly factor 2 [Gammaproteobacteria bacterium]|nr:succinate dehydrogenase assembly factor 2 [Gammaproteobacteria bacterium]
MSQSVQWMCRRSLLELDELFSRFYKIYYQNLSQSEQLEFQQLLELEDGEILSMIYQKDFQRYQILKKLIACYRA